MSLLFRHLKLDERHNILICPLHECVVLPRSISKHFDKHHSKDVTPSERSQLQAEADELCTSRALKTEYSQFEFANADGSPLHEIEYLGMQASLACNKCNHITTKKSAAKSMKGHLRTRHDISIHTDSGRSTLSQHTRAVYSQRYFIGVPADADDANVVRSFEVKPSSAHDQTTHSSPIPAETETHNTGGDETHTTSRANALSCLHAQLHNAAKWVDKERKERLAYIPQGQSLQTNPWLAYTRFLGVLPERWVEALSYTAPPAPQQEPALHYLYCTTKSMVRTWQNSTAVTSRYARIRVMQEDMNDVPLHPLEPYQYFALQHALPLQKTFTLFYRVLTQQLPQPRKLRLLSAQLDKWNHIVQHLDTFNGTYPPVEVSHERTRLGPLEQLCHAFWLSLIEQTCLEDEFELPLVVSTAFLVVSSATKGLREVYNFATDITALKKMIRLASLQKYHEHFVAPAQQLVEGTNQSITHVEAAALMGEQTTITQLHYNQEATNRAVADQFKAWVHDYLTTEYPTTANWLINTARYLSRFRYGENLDAFVCWSGDTVTVRGIRTSLAQYTSMVHNEYEHASSILCRLAFVPERSSLPSIPWSDMVEDPANQTPGFGMFSPESPMLASKASFIQDRLMHANEQGYDVLITNLQSPREVLRYSELVQEFLQTLLGLVHFTSGQPARGTELLSVHHENPSNGMLRNVFLYQGLVAIVPQYHKGYNRDKSLKVIYRFLPRPIGSLLVWYLWLVRPFYALIQHKAPESMQKAHMSRATSSLLWPGQNGEQFPTSVLLRQVIQRATEKWMGQSINLSTMRHLIIAFGRKIEGLERIPAELSREEVEEIVDSAQAEEREMQAGHSAATAKAVYAVDITQMFAKKFDRAQGYFRVSTKWHGALGFNEEEAFNELYPTPKPTSHPTDIANRIQCNYKRLLQENFGKSAVFRPHQESVIKAVMGGDTVVAYIAGTGAGKSMAFLLPACYPGYGQTLVIVPLASLRDDIMTTCQNLSLRATVWVDGHCDQTASIILATPECLAQPNFVDMVFRLSNTGKLERIVVDEFHYVLLPHHKYRPHLLELRNITKFGVRLTLLSATIPFKEQVTAFRLLGVPTDTVPFRQATSRPNLAWQVATISLSSKEDIRGMATYVQTQRQKHVKVLVYVDLTTTADLLSAELQCDRYHGKMTIEERRLSQETFSALAAGIMVATSAYLEGVDVYNIRAILWFGQPDNIMSAVQGGGRGGRDGLPCIVRFVLSPQIPNLHYDKADASCKAIVDDFVQHKVRRPVCRRRVLCAYFDNDNDRLACRTHEEPCDVCKRRFDEQSDLHVNASQTSTVCTTNSFNTATPDRRPPSTPMRKGPTESALVTVTPDPGRIFNASSPDDYQLSAHRAQWTGSSGVSTGSPSVPRRLMYSPRKRIRVASLAEPPYSSVHGNRVLQDAPSSHPEESVPGTCTPVHQTAADFRLAKQTREIEFNAQKNGDKVAERSAMFRVQLPATQAFWTSHCAVCFCAGEPYQHLRGGCRQFVGSLVGEYRRKMNHQWGNGMCWKCFMPANCCPRWNPDGTGHTLQRPDADADCVDKRAILDTWVCFWDRCSVLRKYWVERIRQVRPDFDQSKEKDFREYFQEVVHFGDDHKVNRLCLDVNWLTQTWFQDRQDPEQLRSPVEQNERSA
jgi:superfamily II DNA helicase RecQ